MKSKRICRRARRGAALIIAMVFVLLFSTLAVSLCCMAGSNAQISGNQRKVNAALYAAQSGLECAKRLAFTVTLQPTNRNWVSDGDADLAWTNFCDELSATAIGGQAFIPDGNGIVTGPISFGSPNVSFRLRFYRDADPRTVWFEASGNNNEITRKVRMKMTITKENTLMQYAIASRGRMWLTGDSTIHGNIYSSWNKAEISPFDMTADSSVEGTINTVLTQEEIESDHSPYDDYQFEDPNDPDCVIRGYHEGINYDVHGHEDMPGMDISDYDTTEYREATYYSNGGGGDIYYAGSATNYTGNLDSLGDTCGTKYRYEYFPHAAGNYTMNRPGGGGLYVKRYIYKNQTFTNARLPDNKNALFINCTFEDVLYVDCSRTSTSYTNNVRFDNCTFNGTIVSDTPSYFNWQKNCLYFTGGATFQNDDDKEATILAPHFNVNLGNTNPVSGDENVLTGAIVGGIVDVRGNAQVYGTIVSMADTTMYPSGYVTNIGATLDDGGSETTQPGDVGTIDITPAEEKLLPSGIMSPIVIKPDLDTYSEGV